jgi:hypothetical protein
MKQLQLEGRHACGCSATPSQSILINYESGGVPPPGRKRVRDRAGKAVEVAKQGRWSYHQSRQSRHKKTEFPPPMAGISYLRSEVMCRAQHFRVRASVFARARPRLPRSQIRSLVKHFSFTFSYLNIHLGQSLAHPSTRSMFRTPFSSHFRLP